MSRHHFACLFLYTLLVLAGCSRTDCQFGCIMPEQVELREGDVVFRRGTGMTSRIILMIDTASRFSHSGIVVDSMGVKMVVHAVADEHDFEGDIDRVKMDPLSCFFSEEYATLGEVCRPVDSLVAKRAAEIACQAYRRVVPFDHEYNDSDTTRMYCSELVVYAFDRAGVQLVDEKRQDFINPYTGQRCFFPSDLRRSEFLHSVYVFNPSFYNH